MQLYQTLKEHLQEHNRHLFVNTGLSKLLVNANGECEIAYSNHKKRLSQIKIWDSFRFKTASDNVLHNQFNGRSFKSYRVSCGVNFTPPEFNLSKTNIFKNMPSLLLADSFSKLTDDKYLLSIPSFVFSS